MPNQAFEEKPTGAARALVEHLRRNPDESRGDPAALAARFGLETEFVRRALAHVPVSTERPEAVRGPNRLAQRAGSFASVLDDLHERAARRPIQFETLSLLAAGGLSAVLAMVVSRSGVAGGFGRSPYWGMPTVAAFLFVGAAQMGAFYRRRMVRFAAYGGLVCWLMVALPFMVLVWLNGHGQSEVQLGVRVFWVGLAMGQVGLLYAAAAALASLIGGWVHLRREDHEWERLSRQELLERYFELGRRLGRSEGSTPDGPSWQFLPIVSAVRTRPFLTAALLGVGSELARVGLTAAFGSSGMGAISTISVLLLVESVFVQALFVAVAFLAGRAARGALCAPAYSGGFAAMLLLPGIGLGPETALSLPWVEGMAAGLATYVILGTLAGLGATIQRRAAREIRMQRDDGATLVAEMLEIQRRLEEDATSVTVLVVDAAKSTAMKVGADPLDVEYSFREYQTWLAGICAGFGGRIHSVAGDGAVVAFPDSGSAMGASRRLQTDVGRFNETLNRLPKPFRLRLGLHAGRVAGDLNDVQFTEVIDIAAHVEEIAPVGGIAATAAVVSTLGEEGFLPLARDVDGQAVSIALVPTEG